MAPANLPVLRGSLTSFRVRTAKTLIQTRASYEGCAAFLAFHDLPICVPNRILASNIAWYLVWDM